MEMTNPAPAEEAAAARRRAKDDSLVFPHTGWVIRVLGLAIFATLLVWSQLGHRFLPDNTYRLTDAALVVLMALYTVFLAAYAGRANVRLERAYSEHLEGLSESLRHLAYHDNLTGLYNHRYFHEQLRYEFERACRYKHHLSVAMLDVNRFKEINDHYGHLAGDEVLSFLGRLVGESVRSTDVAARYGGDEFALILPETDAVAAAAVVEKLKDAVSRRRVWGSDNLEGMTLEVAAGVATFPEDATGAEELLLQADRALYASKARALPVRSRRSRMGRIV